MFKMLRLVRLWVSGFEQPVSYGLKVWVKAVLTTSNILWTNFRKSSDKVWSDIVCLRKFLLEYLRSVIVVPTCTVFVWLPHSCYIPLILLYTAFITPSYIAFCHLTNIWRKWRDITGTHFFYTGSLWFPLFLKLTDDCTGYLLEILVSQPFIHIHNLNFISHAHYFFKGDVNSLKTKLRVGFLCVWIEATF